MNTKLIVQRIVATFLFLSLLHFAFFYSNKSKWLFRYSQPTQSEKSKEGFSSLGFLQAYDHLGEGLLGSSNEIVKSAILTQLSIEAICDRIDLSPSILVKSHQVLTTFEINERVALSKLSLNLDPQMTQDMEIVFKLKDHHIFVDLYEKGKMIDHFLALSVDFQQDLAKELDLLFKDSGLQWYGKDLFLKTFASAEYPEIACAERLEFNPKQEKPYSCFLKEKECLVFEDGKWVRSNQTHYKPLLYLDKVSAEELRLILWDEKGQKRKTFILPKSQSSSYPRHPKMTFVGIKTPSVWMILLEGKRHTLKKNDLWFFEQGRWEKLHSAEEFADYLHFKKKGDLFVIQRFEDKNGKKQVFGTWFNNYRCQKKELTLTLN